MATRKVKIKGTSTFKFVRSSTKKQGSSGLKSRKRR